MRLSVVLAIVLAPAVAGAYPQFIFSLGADRCGTCHLSPAGGGLINAYGRDEAGSTVSRGGDGRFLHGLWEPPDWAALGGDFRFATVDRYVAANNDLLVFPMQADVSTRLMGKGFAFAFTAGVRGQSRTPAMTDKPILLERLTSREHYLAYERGVHQVRLGRFFPVFGLRLPDHTAYVRRYLGFNLQEESYGLELARYGDDTVVHLTGFVPPPLPILGSGQRPSGAIAHVEHDLTEEASVGGQLRFATGSAESRYTAGLLGKWWMARAGLLWLAELDVQRQTFAVGPARSQLASYLGVSKWLARGLLAGGAVHAWDPDITLRASTRYAIDATVQLFPRAHFELHLLTRFAASGDLDAASRTLTGMLQLHYYP